MGASSNILNRLRNTRLLPAFLVPLITILGLLFRLRHIFNFYIYPDSYYYLLIADNLRRHGVVYGTLGPNGMHFPPIGTAILKPAYPLFVSLIDRFADNLESSGHIVAIGASVLTIPAAFFLSRRLFRSTPAGLTAAALVAVSYNHVYWSGFLMGDSLAVFLMFVSLLLLLRADKPDYANPQDFLAGIVLALALLSRNTYAVTVPALAWLMVVEFSWSKERLTTALGGLLLTLSITALLILPPFREIPGLLTAVSTILLTTAGLLAVAGLALLAARRYLSGSGLHSTSRLSKTALLAGVFLPALLWLASMASSSLPGVNLYPALIQFVARDKLLALAYLGGVFLLTVSPRRRLGAACAINVSLLLGLYYQVAVWEFRYLIHTLPFLVLPAAFGIATLASGIDLKSLRKPVATAKAGIALSIIMVLVVLSLRDSWMPSRGVFLQTSYQREVSRHAESALSVYPKKTVLLAVLPWPYYFHLGLSSWSIDVKQPVRMLRVLPKAERFLIVSDEPLRTYLPSLGRILAKSKSVVTVARFSVGTPYQSPGAKAAGDNDVTVYELTAPELRRALNSATP